MTGCIDCERFGLQLDKLPQHKINHYLVAFLRSNDVIYLVRATPFLHSKDYPIIDEEGHISFGVFAFDPPKSVKNTAISEYPWEVDSPRVYNITPGHSLIALGLVAASRFP